MGIRKSSTSVEVIKRFAKSLMIFQKKRQVAFTHVRILLGTNAPNAFLYIALNLAIAYSEVNIGAFHVLDRPHIESFKPRE